MSINSIHQDLILAKKFIYDKCGFELINLKINVESTEYCACTFELNGKFIQHRSSKITPTKTGQFVTIWKRNSDGITEPFDFSDDLDFFIITSRSDNYLGQFIFPKTVLAEKGIITTHGKPGKRGIRVYPPWDKVTNKQAATTQAWQCDYFFEMKDNSGNFDKVKNIILFQYRH